MKKWQIDQHDYEPTAGKQQFNTVRMKTFTSNLEGNGLKSETSGI